MRTSVPVLLFVTAWVVPGAAEASTAATGATVAASPWIVLGLLAIVRVFVCFLEGPEDLDAG